MAHVAIRVLSRSKFRTGTARGKLREVGDVRGFCSRVAFVGPPGLEFSIQPALVLQSISRSQRSSIIRFIGG